ncbi:uncharacterized protein LOC143353926 isoform X2 [Halictus rubicundus]|uniref:uncharacterized protein LOC143353926 isoform X2 n=1 Tax=Halictus rubicundus TaxID=77578 RepID=UPI004036158C
MLNRVTMATKWFEYFALIALFQFPTQVQLENLNRRELGGNNHIACAYVQCEKTETCVHRKFRCKNPPCPGMLYCAKSRTESLRGPSTCDTVHCSNGYLCMVKVRHCLWDQKCKQQIARCVSQREYHEGPASCAGFKCPQGHHCILRESLCANPPCKLLRSCSKNRDVHIWFNKCRSLSCSSEFDCFLRKPESTCSDPPCKHTTDCITAADEVENAHCRGWICPRMHKCVAKTVAPCESYNCDVNRTCNMVPQNNSSSWPGSLNKQDNDAQSPQDTIKDEPSQDDLNKILVDVDGLLREWNVTNVEELFGKKSLFVPGYNSSVVDLVHDPEEKEKEILSYQSPENKNSNSQHSHTLPVENKRITDTQINNLNTDMPHDVPKQIVVASQNKDIHDIQMEDFSFNVPEILKYLSIDNYELPSLWTVSDRNFQKEASERADTTIDSFSDVSETADVLEMLMKSLTHFSNETTQENFDDKPVDRSYPENGNKNYASSAVPYFGEDRFTSKNLEELVDQSSLYGGARINFTYNSEPRVHDTVRSSNRTDQSYSSDSGISSAQKIDANNETANLDRFFEMDKEALLSYIETLIEEVDLENDSSNETKRNMDVENLETDSRTAAPSYEDKEPQSFYNLPSYGANDDYVDVKNRDDKA